MLLQKGTLIAEMLYIEHYSFSQFYSKHANLPSSKSPGPIPNNGCETSASRHRETALQMACAFPGTKIP